jgi:hypothetical protein
MKARIFYATVFLHILIFPITAQIKIKPTGRVILGNERATDDGGNLLNMQVLGQGGEYRFGSKIAFGDFGTYNYYGINVFIGEYGNDDTDQLWLHGKNGIYLSWNRGDNLIGYYDVSMGNKFTFNCPIYSEGTFQTSDERFKENIKKIDNPLTQIQKLNGVSYDYNFPDRYGKSTNNILGSESTINGTGSLAPTSKEEKDKSHFSDIEGKVKENQNKKIGFIAQELKKVYPELVVQDSAGYYYVDYSGLIPVIIEALKEQQSIIDAQSLKIKELETTIKSDKNLKGASLSGALKDSSFVLNAFLYQNTPNPFKYSTEIKYFIPDGCKSAMLYVLNLQGTLILSEPINNTGTGSISIEGNRLNPGMYVYTLLIDGIEVDTKRMIVTQN